MPGKSNMNRQNRYYTSNAAVLYAKTLKIFFTLPQKGKKRMKSFASRTSTVGLLQVFSFFWKIGNVQLPFRGAEMSEKDGISHLQFWISSIFLRSGAHVDGKIKINSAFSERADFFGGIVWWVSRTPHTPQLPVAKEPLSPNVCQSSPASTHTFANPHGPRRTPLQN